ncbi:hypothetical protein GIY30_19920 [Gordonia sp. HNM0687]|uniref:Uncharacterized protein n=1 Tax=Gordonia mangrovi TaxID=2665643 RepID=A0A6L7GX50_9ACTN|nr:hypothetical protein [Gordonia mangrovi]MXP23611.1 hypothetical protein [Gordonia mangrovi]UVF79677.1 hypothetical protein NWF22_07540 [Gordonia mangrovi]
MTDDSTDGDRSVDATTDFDERPLAPSLLGAIAARHAARGIPADRPFLVLDVRPGGLRVGLADPRLESVTGDRVAPGIRPAVLDQLLADHLVRTGRIAEPTSDEWTAEVLDLAERARVRLSTSDATFIMGREHVRFVRVARRDLDEAAESLTDQVAGLCDEVARTATEPVTSVVLVAGHQLWPGLPTALAARVSMPVLGIGSDDDTPHDALPTAPAGPEVGGSVPPAVTETPRANSMTSAFRDTGRDAEPVAVVPVAQPSQSGDFPAAWIDDVTTPITEPIAVVTAAQDRAGAPADDPGAPVVHPHSANVEAATAAVDDPYLLDAPVTPVDPAPRTVVDAGPPPPPSGYDPREWAFEPTGAERPVSVRQARPRIPKRLFAGVGAAGVVAVIAVTVAVAVTGAEPQDRSAASPAATQTVVDGPPPDYADPADVVDAGVAAARYTPPPPPPPTTTSEPTQQQQNQPRPRPRPRQRVIPNPIPGLPPIILPG